jgi:hypothetical protein
VALSTARAKLKSTGDLPGKVVAVGLGIMLLGAISVAMYSNFVAMSKLLRAASFQKLTKPGPEYAEAIEWINANTNPEDRIVTNCDPMYFLYTGRKATASYSLIMLTTAPYQNRVPPFQEQTKVFLDIVRENKGGYVVFNAADFKYDSDVPGESILEFVRQSPEMFTPVFQTPDGHSSIFRLKAED